MQSWYSKVSTLLSPLVWLLTFCCVTEDGWVRQRCHLASPGCPTDIGLQSQARPAAPAAGKGRWGMFLFRLFLHCHSFSFLPCPISFISSTVSSISLLPFSGRRHRMTHKFWRVVKPNTIKFVVWQHLHWLICVLPCLLTESLDTVEYTRKGQGTDKTLWISRVSWIFILHARKLFISYSIHKLRCHAHF